MIDALEKNRLKQKIWYHNLKNKASSFFLNVYFEIWKWVLLHIIYVTYYF